MAGKEPTIAVEIKPQTYQQDQFDSLLSDLRELDERTVIQPIAALEDVLMNDQGKTMARNASYSTLALRQLCSSLSTGLSQVVADISGQRRLRSRVESVVSIPAAAKLLNICARLRFQMDGGLFNRQLVVDTKLNQIDGVLGAGYRYLPHADLLETVNEVVAEQQATFYMATLNGRHLTAVWRTIKPLYMIDNTQPVFGGYYIVNSEAAECSVGAAVALLFGQSFRALLPVSSSNRTAHAGSSFKKRVGVLIGSMVSTGEQLAFHANKLAQLQKRPLNLIDASGKVRTPQLRRYRDWLRRKGVRVDVAQDVINAVLYGGGTGAIPENLVVRTATKRTAYDLFVRLCFAAAGYSHDIREPMERAAFYLLKERLNPEDLK